MGDVRKGNDPDSIDSLASPHALPADMGVGQTNNAPADPDVDFEPNTQTAGAAGPTTNSSDESRIEEPFKPPHLPGYQTLQVLGRGGTGVVYKANQLATNCTVALKMILAGVYAEEDQLARFRTEAVAVAQLQHPNIAKVLDVGEHNGLPFLSLEYVAGEPLDQQIEGTPLLPQRAAELTESIARAMHYAHKSGLMHGDLKPANILMTQEGIPKITDFGLVKRLDTEPSQSEIGSIMGTPSYMAPELARCGLLLLPDKGVQFKKAFQDTTSAGGARYCLWTYVIRGK